MTHSSSCIFLCIFLVQCNSTWLYIVPRSIYDMVMWTKERYDNIPVYITENGEGDICLYMYKEHIWMRGLGENRLKYDLDKSSLWFLWCCCCRYCCLVVLFSSCVNLFYSSIVINGLQIFIYNCMFVCAGMSERNDNSIPIQTRLCDHQRVKFHADYLHHLARAIKYHSHHILDTSPRTPSPSHKLSKIWCPEKPSWCDHKKIMNPISPWSIVHDRFCMRCSFLFFWMCDSIFWYLKQVILSTDLAE